VNATTFSVEIGLEVGVLEPTKPRCLWTPLLDLFIIFTCLFILGVGGQICHCVQLLTERYCKT